MASYDFTVMTWYDGESFVKAKNGVVIGPRFPGAFFLISGNHFVYVILGVAGWLIISPRRLKQLKQRGVIKKEGRDLYPLRELSKVSFSTSEAVRIGPTWKIRS